jgi:hypothetical protein
MRLLRQVSLAVACLGFAMATPAAAQNRSFDLGAASLAVFGTATQTSTINLPKSGTSSFFINFVVPLDHAIDTDIRVRVYMQEPTGAACTAATLLAAATRRRIGKAGHNTGSPNVDRITPAGGVQTTAFPPSGGTIVAKDYIVRRPQFAPFKRLRAGDGISIRVDRVSTDPADTCANSVFVSHVDVRYTSVEAP